MRFSKGMQPALDQRSVSQNPAVEDDVIDLQRTLQEA
jgi:hypothetical protein